MKILIVDDESVARDSVKRLLRRRGHTDVEMCADGRSAIERIESGPVDVVLLDLLMPGVDGLKVLEATRPLRPATEFIVITAVDDATTALDAVHLGACDYLVKPIDPTRLQRSLDRAFQRLRLHAGLHPPTDTAAASLPEAFAAIVTADTRMKECIRYGRIIAGSGLPILLTGESGTGKELFARAIHQAAPGPSAPFVPVNVAAVPETLFESHFFGHVAGAFTGAANDHTGYFQQANGGTLFLDEIGEIPLALQAKFLRALEDQSILRLGANRPTPMRVQIISSTNADIDRACQEKRFRLDLYYRLNAGRIRLPTLHERIEDIPLLANHFLTLANRRFDKSIKGITEDALARLGRMQYPGNVRELKGIIENAALLCDTNQIESRHISGLTTVRNGDTGHRLCTLKENTDAHVAYVVSVTGGDLKKSAAILGISLRQVQRRLAQMRDDPQWKDHLDG